MRSNTGYYPLLDGFRAIAVILVLLVHTKLSLFQSGWIGVPMFFVLSGFLITGILLDNKNSKHYFKAFYFRRILRIFPIYYLLLLFCLGWGWIMKFDISQFPYYFLYLQSFSISNSVEPVFCNGLMGHTWSLSIEELFYLVWPALIFILNKRAFIICCATLALFSIGFKFYQAYLGHETLTMLSLFGNLDCLMIGALLSIYIKDSASIFDDKHKTALLLFTILSLSLIGFAFFLNRSPYLLYTKTALSVSTACLSLFLIFYLTSSKAIHPLTRLLSTKAMTYIGKISYGLYLYHIPVYMFVSSLLFHYKISLNSTLEIVFKLVLSFIVAIISWHSIEKPLLSLKRNLKY